MMDSTEFNQHLMYMDGEDLLIMHAATSHFLSAIRFMVDNGEIPPFPGYNGLDDNEILDDLKARTVRVSSVLERLEVLLEYTDKEERE